MDERLDEALENADASVVAVFGNHVPERGEDGDHHLDALDFLEGVDEFVLGVIQAVDAVAEEEVGGYVEGHAVEEVHDVDGLTGGGELVDEGLGPFVEDFEVADSVFDEHGPDQGPAFGP